MTGDMNVTTKKTEIGYALASVNALEMKVHSEMEKNADDLLDSILELRHRLVDLSEQIEQLENKIRLLSFLNRSELLEDDHFSLRVLFVVCQRLTAHLNTLASKLDTLAQQQVIATEIMRFQEASDLLSETVHDVNEAFFVLPTLPTFQKSSDELKALLK
ncbi:MAG: hypothetical protein AAGJ82_11105 [Bacteroidota bacterium]